MPLPQSRVAGVWEDLVDATFKARVNLVMVPVVVRDKQGHAVGGLHQEDFQLFDKGKPQYIARFSVEKATGRMNRAVEATTADKSPDTTPPTDTPDRVDWDSVARCVRIANGIIEEYTARHGNG